MFGKNKVSQEEIEKLKNIVEIDERFFAGIADKKEMFDATVSDLTESFRQTKADLNQVQENIKSAAELATGNVEIEAQLSADISDYRDCVAGAEEKQEKVVGEFHQILDEVTRLVDENKHFTSPSKYLSEAPAEFKACNENVEKHLTQMEDFSRQMGVLALNAAIEAGRLGDSGKQFVTAAEDIRSYAANYEKEIESTRADLEESIKRVAELEEQVHRLVKLLKDNNVSTARLMKSCKGTAENADHLTGSIPVEQITAIYNKVTTLRNADEEIIKSEERNRMQMEDLAEEFDDQNKNQKDILQMIDPLYRHLVEREA